MNPSFCTPLKTIALAITNDSSYTYANLVCSTQSVAFAIVLMAAQFFNLPLPFKEQEPPSSKNDQEMYVIGSTHNTIHKEIEPVGTQEDP